MCAAKLYTCSLALLALGAAARAKPAANHWVATWGASPSAPSGDNLHPNDAGHKAMGEAVALALFQ